MPKSVALLPCLIALTLTACGSAADVLAPTPDVARQALGSAPTFSACEGVPFKSGEAQGFARWSNAMWASQATHHSAQDIIGNPVGDLSATGRFTYGTVHHELQGEPVTFSMNDCSGWRSLGRATTTGEGFAQLQVPAPAVGRYDLMQEVEADASHVAARMYVLPAGTHLVVFDIDGTLTTDNSQYLRQLLDPSYVPHAFPGAVEATQAWAAKGYVVVYMTGRPTSTSVMTRSWLDDLGFTPGHMHLADNTEDMVPTNGGVGAYKRDYIKMLQGLGYIVDFAYGNEPTDVFAYEQAGMDADHIYTLGPKAGMLGTHGLAEGYDAHLQFVEAQKHVVQPYIEFHGQN